MSLKKLPAVQALAAPPATSWDPPSAALERWATMPVCAASEDPATISVFDVIGEDPWGGGGFTAKRAAAALRSIGARAVRVEINSPGGDMFEGLAIYTLLREHKAEVEVHVLGLAASAASIIAMAGDRVTMGMGSFLMIHDAWGLVIGNRNDMRAAADTFERFDSAMADIYAARTGAAAADMAALMDAETWLTAKDAIARGFADAISTDPAPAAPAEARASAPAIRKIDALLAKQGIPRVERRRLLSDARGGTQDAAATATPDAGESLNLAAMARLLETLKI
jgi:ATP-dependent protease ClpP protease subunit